jgi:hypothetical protein
MSGCAYIIVPQIATLRQQAGIWAVAVPHCTKRATMSESAQLLRQLCNPLPTLSGYPARRRRRPCLEKKKLDAARYPIWCPVQERCLSPCRPKRIGQRNPRRRCVLCRSPGSCWSGLSGVACKRSFPRDNQELEEKGGSNLSLKLYSITTDHSQRRGGRSGLGVTLHTNISSFSSPPPACSTVTTQK